MYVHTGWQDTVISRNLAIANTRRICIIREAESELPRDIQYLQKAQLPQSGRATLRVVENLAKLFEIMRNHSPLRMACASCYWHSMALSCIISFLLSYFRLKSIVTLKSRLEITHPTNLCTNARFVHRLIIDLGLFFCYTVSSEKAIQGKMVRYGCSGSFKVIETDTNQQPVCDSIAIICLGLSSVISDIISFIGRNETPFLLIPVSPKTLTRLKGVPCDHGTKFGLKK